MNTVFFKSFLLVVCVFLTATVAHAQNQPPRIANFNVVQDSVNNRVELYFDVVDDENDDVEVAVGFSNNDGETFLVPVISLAGDTGYPVSPGTGKQITFNYSSDSSGIENYQIRLVVNDRSIIDIADLVSQADSARLKNDLSFIEGIRHYQTGAAHLEATKDFIEDVFSQAGLQTYRQPFMHKNYPAHNIIGRLPGLKDEKITYIIDAHFDSVDDAPGADDNGSGVAGVLEAARILSRFNFEHSIKFIGFDFEESSPTIGLEGSRRYVNEGLKNYEQLEGVFNFEMIGYYTEVPNTQQIPQFFDSFFPNEYNQVASDSVRGNFIVNTAVTPSNDLMTAYANAAAQFVPALKVVSVSLPNTPLVASDFWRSDHASFWGANYKAIMLTDGAEFRNHKYHTPGDTIGNLNFTFMSRVVQATIAAVAGLAKIQNSTYQIKKVNNELVWSSIQSIADCEFQISQSSSSGFVITTDQGTDSHRILRVVDIQGKLVETFNVQPGINYLSFSSRLPYGVYLAILEGNGRSVKKLAVSR